ncbi:hypothetical protein [Aureimonas ureilytica]|uniref:hypothetical protein n=1 Tax=Aureimonas ureilytica TaxID=401562 RepID=UPI00128F059F|nr:hypothetical protein [Aureimonas ureilytica]
MDGLLAWCIPVHETDRDRALWHVTDLQKGMLISLDIAQEDDLIIALDHSKFVALANLEHAACRAVWHDRISRIG